MNHIRNLCFEGGGVKGIAYLGALQILESRGILQQCTRFCGNSAGSISAWLSAYFKNDLATVEDIQRKTNFADFADDSIGVVRDAHRLLDKYGWHKGDAVYKWAKDITRQRFNKAHITFQELYDLTGNDLVITACNISKAKTVWFSRQTTPDFYVERAMRMSMSIPIYFRGIFIPDSAIAPDGSVLGNPGIDKDYDRDRDLFVDGGVLDNYPIHAFDTQAIKDDPLAGEVVATVTNRKNDIYNKSTLGLRVDSDAELSFDQGDVEDDDDYYESKNFFQYLFNLIDLLHVTANKRHLDDYDWHRTIRINTGDISATNFELTTQQQDELIASGRAGVERYLDNYANSDWLNKP